VGKRQATIQLTVFADGIARVMPLLIFRGVPVSKSAARRREAKRYDPPLRRSTRLIGKPARSHLVQFPQITDAEDDSGDDDDGVEYDFMHVLGLSTCPILILR